MTLEMNRWVSVETTDTARDRRTTEPKSERIRVVGLRADHVAEPLGLQNRHPRLSWRLESSEHNIRQAAYRVWVASSEALLVAGRGDLWDSGKVKARQSHGVRYAGKSLKSRQRCWWRVQVWDEQGRSSSRSMNSWWEMGLLEPQDWTAQWLAAEDPVARADRVFGLQWIWGQGSNFDSPRCFRAKFSLSESTKSGFLFAQSNGWFAKITQLWLDGVLIAGPGFERSWSKRLKLGIAALDAGEHVIAIEVKTIKSPYSLDVPRRDALTAFMRFETISGRTVRIAAGPTWRTSLEQLENWQARCFDDSRWASASAVVIAGYEPWPARPALYLRRTFSVDKAVVRSRLYATALGGYEARLNGVRVGDALLTPEVSQYAKRALYRVYDVTALLKAGANAIGFVVGDGWYGSSPSSRFAWGPPPCRVLGQLEIIFADGTQKVVATEAGWRGHESPILSSELRVGEVYDARREQSGWDGPDFDDADWWDADLCQFPSCKLTAQISPPIRATEVVPAQAVAEPKAGVLVFDFGRHLAGWCRLRVRGESGTRIDLHFAELLTEAGVVDDSFASMGEAKHDVYILRGDPADEIFEPRFTYRGFRYVQVEGLPGPPLVAALDAIVVHSDLEYTGELRIGNPQIQAIWRNTLESQRSNFVAIPTDCPSREQRAFMADAGLFWDAAAFNMDVAAFTTRQMQNIRDDQGVDGALPMAAPEPHHNSSIFFASGSPPAWGEGGIVLPWSAWQHYGDTEIIEKNWDAMARHVQFILDANPDYVWRNKRHCDCGDWLALDQTTVPNDAPATPRDLFATAYWAYVVSLLADMAMAVGREQEGGRLRKLYASIHRAFGDAFIDADGVVGDGSQTSQILALKFRLVPHALRVAAVARLAADICANGHLTTGIIGTCFSLDVLADHGYSALVYDLLLRTEFPSWGHMIRNGATTMWENWSGSVGGERISRNHFALGAITAFLFRRIAGIDAAKPGFEEIVVRPLLDPRVARGGGDYRSVMGRISTNWSRAEDMFMLDVTIPANATARIYLNAGAESRIEEGGKSIAARKDIAIIERSGSETQLGVGSGIYCFVVLN